MTSVYLSVYLLTAYPDDVSVWFGRLSDNDIRANIHAPITLPTLSPPRSQSTPLSTSFCFTSDMATLHEFSVFESLFQSALEEYEVQTEINLVRHPLAAQLEPCNTVESITEVLQGQAQSFRELPEGNNKIVTLLKQTVQILHKLSAGVVLVESLSLVCRNC